MPQEDMALPMNLYKWLGKNWVEEYTIIPTFSISEVTM